MHDRKHLDVLYIFKLICPAFIGIEQILKLMLREDSLFLPIKELYNSNSIEHSRNFVFNVVLKLLDLFFTLVLESSEIEVVLYLMPLNLVLQVPHLLPPQHPCLRIHLLRYLHLTTFKMQSVNRLSSSHHHRVQKSELWKMLLGFFKVVEEKNEVTFFVMVGIAPETVELLINDYFWVDGLGDGVALRAGAGSLVGEKIVAF